MVHMNQNRINLEFEVVLQLIRLDSYGRDLARELDVPLTNIQRSLQSLQENNIIDFKKIGNNKIYSLKNNLIARQIIFNAENYKLLNLISKYPYLEHLLEDILKQSSSNLVILFGSYAKFRANKNSDIDLYIETKDKNIKKKLEDLHSRLNVKIGLFDNRSLLIQEIIKDHVILKGVEVYYDKIKFFA